MVKVRKPIETFSNIVTVWYIIRYCVIVAHASELVGRCVDCATCCNWDLTWLFGLGNCVLVLVNCDRVWPPGLQRNCGRTRAPTSAPVTAFACFVASPRGDTGLKFDDITSEKQNFYESNNKYLILKLWQLQSLKTIKNWQPEISDSADRIGKSHTVVSSYRSNHFNFLLLFLKYKANNISSRQY